MRLLDWSGKSKICTRSCQSIRGQGQGRQGGEGLRLLVQRCPPKAQLKSTASRASKGSQALLVRVTQAAGAPAGAARSALLSMQMQMRMHIHKDRRHG